MLKLFSLIFVLQFARYLSVSGGAYLYFWQFRKRHSWRRKLQKQAFQFKDIIRELALSLLTSSVFAAVLCIPFHPDVLPWTQIYLHIEDYGVGWWITSFFILLFVHDTYFYWMHRLVHHPKLFSLIHRVHHLSRNPTPFAAYSFHPTEAILEIIWILPLAFILPVHPSMLILFSLVSLAFNVIGHLGIEIYPEGWKTHPVLKYLNRSTLHNDHHRYSHRNYGLYFTWWDRKMGTLRE